LSTSAFSSFATASGWSSSSHWTRIGLLSLDELQQSARGNQRRNRFGGYYMDRAVRAHRQAIAQMRLRIGGCERRDNHLGRDALFLQPHGLFDRDLVEGIHAHLHVGDVDAAAIRFDADLDVVVDDTLDGDENFHRAGSCERMINRTVVLF